jgi:hypothetical protein
MKTIFFLSVLLSVLTKPCLAIDLAQVENELKTTGAVGWIHGSVESQGLYVFTYRSATNFFDYVELSLTSDDPAIQKQFAALARHDQVRVKGAFLAIPVPQKHIGVTSIELVKKYESGYPSDPYQHQVVIPGALLSQNTAIFQVHAVAAGGNILVVEYQDSILPIFVKNANLTKNLYRGDIVTLNYKFQNIPAQPVHLQLNEEVQDSVKVLQSIISLHQTDASGIQGRLILFPKSPEISLNVFAVEAQMPANLLRQYTLVNFDDPAVFNAILKKCQQAWDQHPGDYTNGRNKLISKHLQVRIKKGIYNEVDPNQANAQILIKSADDLEVIEK